MELIATCAFGLEKLLYQEIKKLGLWVIKTEDGRVTFKGEKDDIVRANLWLRTAERVQIKLAEFEARTFDELFDQTYALDWPSIVPEDATFPVLCTTTKSTLHNEPAIQSIAKKAIVKKLQTVRGSGNLPETGPTYSILTRFNQDICTLSLDTTGDSLHKRGYRQQANLAPLKETLAAALVLLSDWTPEIALVDPFCGSGTILIEAAMIGLNIAPGMIRYFAFQNWSDFPAELLEKYRREAKTQIIDRKLKIFGYDIDGETVKIARQNAANMELTKQIDFTQSDFRKLKFENLKDCTIITNPPYGERLSNEVDVAKLYTDLGKSYNMTNHSSLFLLTGFEEFQEAFARPADKNRKLFNGKLKCYLYQYFKK